MTALRHIIERFLTLDPEKQNKWTSLLIYQVRFYIQIARQLVRDNCLQQAQSLSFSTLLSMVPIVALIFSFFRSFANLQNYENVVQDFLEKHLLADSAIAAFDKIKEFSQNISAVNDVVAAIFFLVFSLMLFNTIEGTINSIWRVKKARSLFDRFITYWILVTLGPLMIVVSLQISHKIGEIAYLGALIKTIINIFPMSFIVIALVFTYKLVPNTKVRWKPAIIGGIVAGILFELAKRGFNLYVTRLEYYNSIYASLTVLVFFLLWVYVAWVIVLFGTEVSYTIQNLNFLFLRDQEAKLKLKKTVSQSVVNYILGLRVFWVIARQFDEGKENLTVSDLAAQFDLQEEVTEEVIHRLEDGRIVVRTTQPGEGLIPARSLDSITIHDVITRFHSDFPPSNPTPLTDNGQYIDLIINQLEQSQTKLQGNRTFGELLEEARNKQSD